MTKRKEKKSNAPDEGQARNRKYIPLLLLLALLALIPLQALSSIRLKSATFEEGVHLSAGAYSWATGDVHAFPGYPILTRMWLSLPLMLTGAKIPAGEAPVEEMYPFEFGTEFLYTSNDADSVLFQGRLMAVLLSMILGFFLYRMARELFGWKAAIFSLALYTFSPNILAHSRLATPDLAFTATLFLALFYYRRAVLGSGKKRILLAILFAWLTLNTKFAGLLLFPILVLWNSYLSFQALGKKQEQGNALPSNPVKRARRAWILLALLFLFALFLINLEYEFRGSFQSLKTYHASVSRGEKKIESSVFSALASLPGLSSIPLPLPRTYMRGLDLALHADWDQKHPNWYLGERATRGEHWWHYFLVALALKVPVPVLLLFILSLVAAMLSGRRDTQNRGTLVFLLLPCLVFLFFFSFLCHSQLGLRLVLPILPFLFVGTGFLSLPLLRERLVRALPIYALLFWAVVASLVVYPHYLSYFNELGGGPGCGIEYFADSNLDWGQDLKGLKSYMDERGIKRVHLRYYGPDGMKEPAYYGIEIPPLGRAPRAPWAISATWLYYSKFQQFKEREPDHRIGYSIYIYESGRSLAPRVRTRRK